MEQNKQLTKDQVSDLLDENPDLTVDVRLGNQVFVVPLKYMVAHVIDKLEEILTPDTKPNHPNGFLPAGYMKSWGVNFNVNKGLAPDDNPITAADWIGSGLKTHDKIFDDCFRGWGVRDLEANGDQANKIFLHGVTHQIDPFGDFGIRLYAVNRKSAVGNLDLPYSAGMISNEVSGNHRYFLFDTVCRINSISKGHHLALWSCLAGKDKGWPPEIDWLEVVNDPANSYFNCHERGDNGEHIKGKELSLGYDFSQWTRLTGIWRPANETHDEVVLYLNETFITSRLIRKINGPMWIASSWEVGSGWPGPADKSTDWPAAVDFQYWDVYQNPDIDGVSGPLAWGDLQA